MEERERKRAVRTPANPKGIESPSPGLCAKHYPGWHAPQTIPQPGTGCIRFLRAPPAAGLNGLIRSGRVVCANDLVAEANNATLGLGGFSMRNAGAPTLPLPALLCPDLIAGCEDSTQRCRGSQRVLLLCVSLRSSRLCVEKWVSLWLRLRRAASLRFSGARFICMVTA